MTDVVYVTHAQIKAAQLLVERQQARGEVPDPSRVKIANAEKRVFQSQESLTDQLRTLYALALDAGLYDAADAVKHQLLKVE